VEVVIEARKISFGAGAGVLIKNLELRLLHSEAYAFFGPSGSGNSEILKLIFGSVPVNSGELFLFGLDLKKNWRKLRSQMAYIPEHDVFDTDFDVRGNLLVYAGYLGIYRQEAEVRIQQILRCLELSELEHELISDLSPFDRRRLSIGRALLSGPKILIVDRPAQCLPRRTSEWIWNCLRDLGKKGTTLVFATQRAEEVEALANKVTLMHEGHAITAGKANSIRLDVAGENVVEFICRPADVSYYIAKLRSRYDFHVEDNAFVVFLRRDQDPREIFSQVVSDQVHLRKTTIQDAYIKVIQDWGVPA
jgi:lipooligosaccharide transport system ATP-binding protein